MAITVAILVSMLAAVVDSFESFSVSDRTSYPSNTRSGTANSELFARAPVVTGGRTADERRQESLEQGNHPLISLNLNLDALARSGGAAPRAQELLQRIHALYQEGYYEVSPDVVSYNSVLKAWKEEDNPTKAYELLQNMVENQADSEIEVDVISFNTVILAFAKQGNYPQAEDLLRQMQQRNNYPNPDAVTFNAVLYAFAQSSDEGTAIQAENLLKEMMRSPQCNVTVDTTTFNTVLHAWARTADNSSPAAANRAQHLLGHMEQLSEAGNPNVVPDTYSYTTVIQAWANCREPLKSQRVLDRMTARNLVPNRFTYTAVMSGLAKAGKTEKAEQILSEMMDAYDFGNEDLKPDTVAFSSVIDGWAKLSGVDKPEAGEHALRLLAQMKRLENEGMGPNARTYTSVLTALAKSGTWEACDKARELLNEMEAEYKEGNKNLRPTTIHYNTVLLAYARSPRADKALKASGFLQSMLRHPSTRCRPDTISYNSLLMACANAFGNQELKQTSFAIALEAFKAVCLSDENNIRPTSTSFAHFCKSARRLLDPKHRQPVLGKTLKLCCEKGLLNHVIVQQIQTTCRSEQQWKQVAGALSDHMSFKDRFDSRRVPQAWTANARR